MPRLTVSLAAADPAVPAVELEARDIASALAIADINADTGPAELYDGANRLGRVTRHGEAGRAPFWRID